MDEGGPSDDTSSDSSTDSGSSTAANESSSPAVSTHTAAESSTRNGPQHDGKTGSGEPPVRTEPSPQSPTTLREWVEWVRTVDSGPVMYVREILSSALIVIGIGLLLFAISGVWPPMVAVQSGSMQPHMTRGDLVFVVHESRFAGNGAVAGTGIVTYRQGVDGDYQKFGAPGDVIVYHPNGATGPDPIIHRAHFYVEEGENWYDRANPDYIRAEDCEELRNCPAPHSGFITKGDNPRTNRYYDQAEGMSRPVKPEWIQGKAMVRIPFLGWIRLQFGTVSHGVAFVVGFGILSLTSSSE